MAFFFCDQHWSTAFRHHSAERLRGADRLVGDGHEDRVRVRRRIDPQGDPARLFDRRLEGDVAELPSASISWFATGTPFTINSTGTFRLFPIRERSRLQYGFSESGRS